MIHFIHIGKTGGTAFQNAILDCNGQAGFHLHGHQVRLSDIPVGEKVIFFLRHPVSRFVSAFYSRYRQGLPMSFRPWKPAEEIAFKRFETANALAEALSSADTKVRVAAEEAMRNIGHVKSSFYDWIKDDAYFAQREDDILYIGLQESLASDLSVMKRIGIVPENAFLPDDAVKAHRIPDGFDQSLSSRGIANIEAWYASDIGFYQAVKEWRRQRGLDAGQG